MFQSNYLTEQTTEDGSKDYLIDWNTFSFEDELERNKKLLSAFKLHAQPKGAVESDDRLIERTRTCRDIHCELLADNELTLSKHDALVNKYKLIKKEVDDLTLKNLAVEMSIKKQEEDEKALQKEYRLQKMAYQKAIEMYSKCFDLNVDVKNVSESSYEASVKFGKTNKDVPIKFTVDRANRNIIDFEVKGVVTPTEEEDLKKRYGNQGNYQELLCTLHDIVLSKQN